MIVIGVPCYYHIALCTLIIDGGRREEESVRGEEEEIVFDDCDLCAVLLAYYFRYSSRGWREEGRGDWKSRIQHMSEIEGL